ncbi:Protein CBG24952 [Caenorhabditis briggsae]|uniref:Protein CBG24952 n=1 Tax=Caenorhabditis briggsae TaxID=6238 RepID=A8WLU1_CAEBR|nr:Protein CBG24952 [Caenorhabditis briggsae]CAP21438.2 Protein CBG24952 [Caenorhabditis briggsae]
METSTTILDQANYWFPDSEDKLFLRNVVQVFEFIAHPTIQIQFYIAIIGLIITFFHLIILKRKSIMTTSVISIMIGIGLCDFVAMIATIIYSWIIYNEDDDNPCLRPFSENQLYIFWIFINIRELVRRTSTWLGVLLALVRYINLKFCTQTKFQHYAFPLYGFRSSINCFLASIPFSIIYYFRYNIIYNGNWNPPKDCGIVNNETTPVPSYIQIPSALFTEFNGIFGKIYMFLNGVASKILPCILLPLLTFLLINEIKKTDRGRMMTGSFMKKRKADKTTSLVIFMTCTFFIVEFPSGIVVVLQVAFTELGYL